MNSYSHGAAQRPKSVQQTSSSLPEINIQNPGVDLFDTTAKAYAEKFAENKGMTSHQLRKFYEEICRFCMEIKKGDDGELTKQLPFIRMLNARAAYAKTRGHVSDDFVGFTGKCLGQIEKAQHLHNFKLLFEAIIGFFPKK